MNTYRVWGEYGPVAGQFTEFTVRARSLEGARKQGIKLLKKTIHWDMIGEHNVYVEKTLG